MIFTSADLPSSIGTVEEVLVWAASILAEATPDQTLQTDRNTIEPVVTLQTYRFANELTNRERVVMSAYIPLTTGWRNVGNFWEGGLQEVSTAGIPAGYTT